MKGHEQCRGEVAVNKLLTNRKINDTIAHHLFSDGLPNLDTHSRSNRLQSIKAGDFVVVACERPSHLHVAGKAYGPGPKGYQTLQQTLKARRDGALAKELWEPCVFDLQNGIAVVQVYDTWEGLGGRPVMQGRKWLLPEETKFGR